MTEMRMLAEDQDFWDDIWAPKAVAIQPDDAVNGLCVCADGEIRHYGIQLVKGKVRQVYLASRDMGLTWKTHLQASDDGGSMARCPWDDYWLSMTWGNEPVCRISRRGPGFPIDECIPVALPGRLSRPLLPLRHRHRWICPMMDVNNENWPCYHAGVGYSDDDGRTWTYVHIDAVPGVEHSFACDKRNHWFNDGCEPSIAELEDGTLLMALRTSGEYAAFARSEDGGENWTTPVPVPGFWQANTMPTLLKLKDGRLLFVWNNTAMLPTRDLAEMPELDESAKAGLWETVFTNRDALHAAISEDDGKTWLGFRELYLNPVRNETDFRELGNEPDQHLDKSIHQGQMMELPNGKILLAMGQNAVCRRILLFDPGWLYENSRTEDFRHGLGTVSHHLYVRSLSGGARGWAGHCAWNRMPGVVMAREPETGRDTVREDLLLCRLRDDRLVSTRAGFVWNFPAAPKGRLEIECRIEGEGFQLALQDHWSNPCDEYLVPRSYLVQSVQEDFLGGKGHWKSIVLEWNLDDGKATLRCGEQERLLGMRTDGLSAFGPSYLHIQTLAKDEDQQGTYFRSLKMEKITR